MDCKNIYSFFSCFCRPNSSSQNENANSSQGERYKASRGPVPSPEIIIEALEGVSGSSESPSLKGRNLTPISSASVEDKKAMEQREGSLLQCVERIKVPEGYIYKYRLRDEYDVVKMSRPGASDEEKAAVEKAADDLSDFLFPAVETIVSPYPSLKVKHFDWDYGDKSLFSRSSERVNEVVKELGYKLEYTPAGVFIQFPDKEVIENRWKGIMARHPDWNLKELIIQSCEGVASDREFIDSYYNSDVLLSTSREFVHDQQFHMLNTIKFIVEDPQGYLALKRYHRETLKLISGVVDAARDWLRVEFGKGASSKADKAYLSRLEKNLAYADVIPSIFADLYAASHYENKDLPREQDIVLEAVGVMLAKSSYARFYLPKRFPDKDISMSWVWEQALIFWGSAQELENKEPNRKK